MIDGYLIVGFCTRVDWNVQFRHY